MSAPGTAVTDYFHFSQATLMVAPMANQLTMNPAAHALGLVKNVSITTDVGKVDLGQGLTNDIVATAVNSLTINATAEVYEYTPKNLAYGMGLNGAALVSAGAADLLTANVSPAATTAVATGNVTAKYPANQWAVLQQNGGDDVCHLVKVASSAFSTNTTVTFTNYPTPAGVTFSTPTARIKPINKIDIDPSQANNLFSVRFVGVSYKDNSPIVVHFPKCRITKGFAMAFNSDNFGNLPFEFMPLSPVSTDSGYSADFTQRMSVFVP